MFYKKIINIFKKKCEYRFRVGWHICCAVNLGDCPLSDKDSENCEARIKLLGK
jgi:hypothetical protein